jgi:hypothetical protein
MVKVFPLFLWSRAPDDARRTTVGGLCEWARFAGFHWARACGANERNGLRCAVQNGEKEKRLDKAARPGTVLCGERRIGEEKKRDLGQLGISAQEAWRERKIRFDFELL